MRQEIHALDPAMATYNETTMEEHLRDALFLPRLAATLFGVFGVCGVMLAAVGLYGVTSYAVSRRTREIGIRMALGAQVRDVLHLVVADGMKPTLIGVIIGIAGALALGRVVAKLVYGVNPADPSTLFAVALILAAVAFFASVVPAYRATKVEPMTALHEE